MGNLIKTVIYAVHQDKRMTIFGRTIKDGVLNELDKELEKTPKNRAKKLRKLGISRKYAWSTAYSFTKSYVSYRKPRAVSTEQRERARQMMIGQNRAIGRKDYPGN